MELTGTPQDYGWVPHRPETWSHRYAKTKELMTLSFYAGRWEGMQPVMNCRDIPAGSVVKIVMVSRFGDVGITDNMGADAEYGVRVSLDQLCDFKDSHQ